MSEITRVAIGMPFEMAMSSELSRRQFHSVAQALLAERDQLNAGFKNFHRSLCERFGYYHDDIDWQRDQVSLEEHIAAQFGHVSAENSSLRSQMEAVQRGAGQLAEENEALRKLSGDTGNELRKASSWICREVEAGTQSATHWAIRLREKADLIDAAMGKGERS